MSQPQKSENFDLVSAITGISTGKLVIPSITSQPTTNTTKGSLVFDSSTNSLYIANGTTWNNQTTANGYFAIVPGAVNFPLISPSIAGQPVMIETVGADAVVGLDLRPKGEGRVTIRQGLDVGIFGITHGTDFAMSRVSRITTHTGGNPGLQSSAFRTDLSVGAGVTNLEWGIVGVLHNSATAGQNVAIYGQGNKMTGAGPTWASVLEARDQSGLADPVSGLVALEIDIFANGTDVSNNRVGIDMVCGPGIVGVSPEVGAGIRIGPVVGDITKGSYKFGLILKGIMGVAITTQDAILSGPALRMATTQYISFNTGDTVRLTGVGSSIRSTGGMVSTAATAAGGVGYATGAGGAVTQLTSKITGVTLNANCGRITTFGDSIATLATASFVFTNSSIAATDVIMFSVASGGTIGAYVIQASAVTSGACNVSIYNHTAGALAEAIVINFVVIKGVSS